MSASWSKDYSTEANGDSLCLSTNSSQKCPCIGKLHTATTIRFCQIFQKNFCEFVAPMFTSVSSPRSIGLELIGEQTLHHLDFLFIHSFYGKFMRVVVSSGPQRKHLVIQLNRGCELCVRHIFTRLASSIRYGLARSNTGDDL